MQKSLLRLTLLMTLLLSLVLMTSAHEEREVGTYILDFGWQQEPVYTGLLNGVELTIFVAEADDHSHDHDHSDDEDKDMEDDGHSHDDEGDDHSHDDEGDEHDHSDDHNDGDSHEHAHDETIEIMEDIPTLELTATVMDDGMIVIDGEFTNFSFEPDKRDLEHVDGEGHGHFFIDGERDGYYFGEPRELMLAPGEHTVMVTLHANSHEALTVGGEPFTAMVSFTVPGEMDMADDSMDMSDEGHSHDAMKTVDGADLQVEITFGPASVILPPRP